MDRVYADRDYICGSCGSIFNQDNADGHDAAFCICGEDNWERLDECEKDMKEIIVKECCSKGKYNYKHVLNYLNNMTTRFIYITEEELDNVIKQMMEE
jgi:hypothetical protein